MEYVHIVVYFERHVQAPVTPVAAIGRRIEQAVGAGPIEHVAFALPGPPPHAGWIQKQSGDWLSEGEIESAEALCATLGAAADSPRTWLVSLSKQRPGAASALIDFDWDVAYNHESDFPVLQWDADLVTSIRLGLFDDNPAGRRALRQLVDDVVSLSLQAGDAYYLLVDVAEMRQTGADGIYDRGTKPIMEPRSLARGVEKQLWQELRQQRRGLVRGVFWGNYLGPALLDRLGGREPFKTRYLAHAKEHLREWRSLVTEQPSGGLFVRISPDPMDESDRGMPRLGTDTAVWLHKELRRVGALL